MNPLRLTALPLLLLLAQCSSAPRRPMAAASSPTSAPAHAASSGGMIQIINVSAYDPKERQRNGRSYSENDVSALRASGAAGLIARAGKGGNLDTKCGTFLASADRAGMLPGVYYRLQTHVDAVKQADQFISRAQSIARSRSWNAPALLLCADFDAKSRLSDMTRFLDRVESRTGVTPVVYLENSEQLRLLLSGADSGTKAKLRRAPYWCALYNHTGGAGRVLPAPGSPEGLTRQYNVWSDWTLWQYGGVDWQHGRSQPKVYSNGRYHFPTYFGNLDRPVERNVFKGSHASLVSFWQRHGIKL